jgi:catechol 2,3-dioxygenase-like lactoylglutathione lyase family enzyme
MGDLLEFGALSHLNLLSDGYQRTKDRLIELFDVQINLEIPAVPGDDTDAFLFTLGDVITEAFCPRGIAERGQGRLLGLYGEHYLGVEFEVVDVAETRRTCERLGVRIIRDEGHVIFTHPGACCGLAWELFEGDFHRAPHGGYEGDEGSPASWIQLKSPTWWRDEHPLGVVGLSRVTVGVQDLDAAITQFQSVVAAEIVDRPDRPAATAAQLLAGETVFELLAPTDEGPLSAFVERYGDRMKSAVYRVADLGRVEAHLIERGVTPEPGDAPGTLAVPRAEVMNLGFEFSED